VATGQAQIDQAFSSISAKFTALHELQVALFGEFSDLNSILFTAGLALIVWWLTALRQLRTARLTGLLLCLGYFMLERTIVQLPWRQASRSALVAALALTLARATSQYIDLEKANHQMLSRVLEESVDKTPVWFGKYKSELLSQERL
jgi:hypothetical protein